MDKLLQFLDLLNLNIESYSKLKKIFLFCCLCLLFLVISVTSLLFPMRESLTYDESGHYESGLAVLSGKPSQRGATEVNDRNIMPASALNPLFSEAIRKVIPKQIISQSTKESNKIYFGKAATIFVSLILAIYVFCWSRQLYGINGGFLGLCLYLLDPNIIAHSRLVTQDIFGACSIFIATYYFWNLLKFGGCKNGVLSMITFGVAQISRYTSIYLLPIYFILAIGFYSSIILNLIQKKKFKIILLGIKQFCAYTILLFLTTVLIINIGFSFEKTFTRLGEYQFESRALTSLQSSSPLLRALPVPVPYAYLRGLDMGKYKQEIGFGSGVPYLMGKIGWENDKLEGFKEYYIIAFLYKVPIATQLLLFMAFVSLFKYRNRIKFWQNEAFLIIPLLFFFIAFSFTTAQLGIRYILMIFPFLFVFSSRIAVGWTALRNRYRIFVTGLVAYLLISNLSYFPHYLSYFNELLVDRKMGYKILADSNLDWGQSKYYLQDYLTKNPETMYAPRWSSVRLDPRNKLPPNKVFYPVKPQAGLMLIEINNLLGITDFHSIKTYQLIRDNLKPVAHIAYSYLVLKIQPEEIENLKTPAKSYSINKILNFQANSNNSLDYQWNGWSLFEEEGTWTDGKEAHLFLKLPNPVKHNLILDIEAVPFIHENHPQQAVDVLVNEELVTQLRFKIGKPLLNQYEIPISAKLINSQSFLQITFRIANPVSPHSLGLGEDKRLLGLMLKKMKLVEDKIL